jgi:hypothetical protein
MSSGSAGGQRGHSAFASVRHPAPRRPPAASNRDDDEGPTKYELSQRADKTRPLVTVRLSVHYRVHSRQILCIGGNQIPMGWSFLSIAKVPMTWNAGDVWSCEVREMHATEPMHATGHARTAQRTPEPRAMRSAGPAAGGAADRAQVRDSGGAGGRCDMTGMCC